MCLCLLVASPVQVGFGTRCVRINLAFNTGRTLGQLWDKLEVRPKVRVRV